jgi:hypothetical protein
MYRRFLIFELRSGILAALFFSGIFASHIQAQPKDPTTSTLFSLKAPPISRSMSERSSPASVKETVIELNSSARALLLMPSIDFPLFDGKIHTANLTELEKRSANDLTWRGKVVGSEDDVIITLKGDHIAGLIYDDGTVYEIVPMGVRHVLMQIDQDLFPLCGGAPTVGLTPAAVERSAGAAVG